MEQLEAETETKPLTREFTLNDRCDQCSAAAKMEYLLVTGLALMFCGHHSRDHHEKLLGQGATPIVDRERAEVAVPLADDDY